ncbi:MAG: helix-turn-helix domain-containing protein, partial [Treponema sp.]|nr:helix-turn-helix domain-containing protein [Treponema sp.]
QKNIFITHNLHIIWITNIQPEKRLWETTEILLAEAQKWEKCPLFFGIGKRYEDHHDGRQSYLEALKAVGIADIHNPVVDYCEGVMSIALYSIPEETKKEYLDQVFGDCSQAEIQDIVHFVTAYRQCNGSIGKIAKRLYMHKNTAQYRILKISKRLGFDIRGIDSQTRLHIACELMRKN